MWNSGRCFFRATATHSEVTGRISILFGWIGCVLAPTVVQAQSIDLSKATIVIRSGELPPAEKVAPTILTEEIAKRTGIQLKVTSEWPTQAELVIAISTAAHGPAWQGQIISVLESVPKKAEAFSIQTLPAASGRPLTIAITGHDPRGAMYGVGKLLRAMTWKTNQASIAADFNVAESPDRPLRGHQIGYRDTANSWDAWNYDQFDQHFREMAIFGANAVENIPFHDARLPRVMKYTREQMNIKFGELCEKYELEHWVWVPVEVRLPDDAKEAEFLKAQETFYRTVKRLDAIFVPGGDPGNNKAVHLVPHLEKMITLARKYHSNVKMWLSLQHFKDDDIDLVIQYLEQQKPDWFGGLVMGPGSPPMEATRQRLPKAYHLRWYPDITHVVRCQYPIPWLDPAWGETLGRECVNPRPVDMSQIYEMDYRFTNGFLTYSDGVHDDFNKNLWSQLGWNPNRSVREIAADYARFFFHGTLAESGADGLFALETNLRGSLADNGSVSSTYDLWTRMEKQVPETVKSWRFRMHLFRAYYDYYTRERFLYEAELERRALAELAPKPGLKAADAIAAARTILQRATTNPIRQDLYDKLVAFCDELFQSIGLQTSVPKYDASGYERGAVLDFLNYPLNNRWWLEDQFDKISEMKDANEQSRRLSQIRNWENPGEGGYYDVLGHVGRSPHMIKPQFAGDAMRNRKEVTMPTQRWVGEKRLAIRQAWHNYQDEFPGGLVYNGLDPSASYVVKLFAQKTSPLVIDGVKAKQIREGDTFDQVTEQYFEVPAAAVADGRIKLTWEQLDESNINWRHRHYVTDIWVMKSSK